MSATPRSPASRRSRSLTGVYVAPIDPVLLRVPRTRFLEISGRGAPASEEFQECLGALYGIAYTVKFAHKAKGHDFKLGPLEGLYWGIDWEKGHPPRSEEWRWRLLVPVPESVHRDDLDRAILALDAKGRGTRAREVRIADMVEGECVQILHIGPYDQERGTIARMEEFARSHGRQMQGPHHEIYLSDPRRVPPSRLRTLLRCPVVKQPAPTARPHAGEPILATP